MDQFANIPAASKISADIELEIVSVDSDIATPLKLPGSSLPGSFNRLLKDAAIKHGSRKPHFKSARRVSSGKTFEYCRFSTDNQHESSIERQMERNRRAAASYGFVINESFVDRGVTGASFERAGLNALFAALRQNPGSRVVVEEMSRLCRTIEAYCNIYLPLLEAGAELYDANGPVSELMGPIQAAIASYDRTNIVNRLKRHRHKFMKEGRYMSVAPYGYTKDPRTKKLILEPVSAAVVKDLFEKRANGASLGTLVRDLNARSVPTPQRSKHWFRSTVSRMLTNPIYAGLTVYNVDDEI